MISIALASDHAGYDLKQALVEWCRGQGLTVVDLGTQGIGSVDYPDFGIAAGQAVVTGRVEKAVVVCGTGIGISIAANRIAGVRAALCHDVTTARMARAHNDANVLALGARVIGPGVAQDCLEAFLGTEFEGGRHERRVAKLK